MQRVDKRKYHYIYKITRFDGKYYIGMHSTSDLEDGYFGSGKLITRSIKKYGKEKHSKEILEYLPSRIELKNREKELVTEEIVNDPFCMNLQLGGGGGFINEQHKADFLASSGKGGTKSWRQNILLTQTPEAKAKKIATKRANGTLVKNFTTTGFKYPEESKRKMSESGSGSNNSNFGKCWINDGVKAITIKKELLQEYLDKGYSKGRSF